MPDFSFIKGLVETSFIDWDGQVVSVLFTGGCNFRCPYCQNAPLVCEPEKSRPVDFQKIINFLKVRKGWVDGVCITGGEPLIQKDLPELLKFFRGRGLKIKLDTNGSLPEAQNDILREKLVDFVAMDLKGPLDNRYFLAAGGEINLENIQQSLEILKNSGVPYELRITCVPGITGEEELRAMLPVLAGIQKFVLQNFKNKQTLDPRLAKIKPYTIEELRALAKIIEPVVPKVLVRS